MEWVPVLTKDGVPGLMVREVDAALAVMIELFVRNRVLGHEHEGPLFSVVPRTDVSVVLDMPERVEAAEIALDWMSDYIRRGCPSDRWFSAVSAMRLVARISHELEGVTDPKPLEVAMLLRAQRLGLEVLARVSTELVRRAGGVPEEAVWRDRADRAIANYYRATEHARVALKAAEEARADIGARWSKIVEAIPNEAGLEAALLVPWRAISHEASGDDYDAELVWYGTPGEPVDQTRFEAAHLARILGRVVALEIQGSVERFAPPIRA
jgi:hypothetical protein